MHQKHGHHIPSKEYEDFSCSSDGDSLVPAREVWDNKKLGEYVKGKKGRCVVVVKGYVVDVTEYLGEHVSSFHFQRFSELLSYIQCVMLIFLATNPGSPAVQPF